MMEYRDFVENLKEVCQFNKIKTITKTIDGKEQPLLLFLNYSPNQNCLKQVSIALTLEGYENNSFINKCWATSTVVKEINGRMPKNHNAYKEFQYGGQKFNPYSIQTNDKFTPKNPESIKKLVDNMYHHDDSTNEHNNLKNNFLSRTKKALGDDLIKKIEVNKYVIAGCGGIGALFAEMLVRTGAKHITLIDKDKVEESNLNRVLQFTEADIGKKKVEVLSERLKKINPDVQVKELCLEIKHSKDPDSSNSIEENEEIKRSISDSNVVLIAIDNNKDRAACEGLCEDKKKDYLSIGVLIENQNGDAQYECTWNKVTPSGKLYDKGYGNGSYASIVMEAASAGFQMFLHHIKNPGSQEFTVYVKRYCNFFPKN